MSPIDSEFIKWLTTLGIGGILAGFMFVFYRRDVRQYTELWKSSSDQFAQIVKDNTESNVRLIVLIETQSRESLRKSDFDTLVRQRIEDRLSERQSRG